MAWPPPPSTGTADCTFRNQLRLNPTLRTEQSFLPNDSAIISGASANAGGNLTFELFGPADATCSGTPPYAETVAVNGSGRYSTGNTEVLATTPGTWRWKVAYSGDAANTATTSACGVENFTISNG